MKTQMSNEDIAKALRYCAVSDGDICNMCPYAFAGVKCSKTLLKDAANRIEKLAKEE